MDIPANTFSRLSFKRNGSKKINLSKGEQHWKKVLQARGNQKKIQRDAPEEDTDQCTDNEETRPLTEQLNLEPCQSSVQASSSASSSSTFFQRMSSWLNSRRKITSRSLKRKIEKKSRPGHMKLRRAKGFDYSNIPDDSEANTGRSVVRVQESNGLSTHFNECSRFTCHEDTNGSRGAHLFNHSRIVVTESDDPNYVFIHNKFSDMTERRHGSLSPLNARRSLIDQTKQRNMFLAVPMDTRQMLNVPEPRDRTPEEKRLPLTATASCPARSPTSSELDLTFDNTVIKRSWTWPFHKKKTDERDPDDINVSDFRKSRFNSSMDKTERFEDFSIPFKDLEFGDCLRTGRNCSVYRGRWHGSVSIHYFRTLSSSESCDIWNVVTKLHWVRHEHVALFMGVCLEQDHIAVVLSFQDGISMYEHIHIKSERISLQARVDLIRQVGYGMGYLHSRDIIHKKLNTRNVFLCPNVRVSVMDFAITDKKYDREDSVCLYKGELAYIAPEVLSTMTVCPPSLVARAVYTMESDVYAFGTLVYEFLSGKHPFHQHPPETLIWQVCSRRRQPLNFRNKTRTLQMLIESCWSHDPKSRPSFQSVNKDLHKKTFLHKQHSCSESDLLMRCGGNGRSFL